MFHVALFLAIISESVASDLLCYECWNGVQDLQPRKLKNWIDCDKGIIARVCVGNNTADQCITLAVPEKGFEVKGCLSEQLGPFVDYCVKNWRITGVQCNICNAHLCNKFENAYRIPLFALFLTVLLLQL